jgi:hypothetical protein
MFDLIDAPLVGRDPIAGGGEDEIVLLILIGPKRASFGTEGAGASSYGVRPFWDAELGGATVAASSYSHLDYPPNCVADVGSHQCARQIDSRTMEQSSVFANRSNRLAEG